MDFLGHCLGVGTRYEALVVLSRRERQAGIKPDPEIDAIHEGYSIVRSQNQFGNRLCSQGWCLSLSLLQIINITYMLLFYSL